MNFSEGCSWFKFNNLGLALGMALRFGTSVEKALKLKVRMLWGLISTFVGVTGKRTGRRPFAPIQTGRSSHRNCSVKKLFLKFRKFDIKAPVLDSLFSKLYNYNKLSKTY